MKKFLILGSNSFSGSHFCTYLIEQGHWVLATSRSNEPHDVFLPYKWEKFSKGKLNFASLDLNHDQKKLLAILDDFKPTHIINFAAQSMVSQSWQSPRDWVRTNVDAITQVAHSLKEYQSLEKFIHVSTPEVYGSTIGLVKEDTPFNPSTPYAVSRAAGDMMLQAYQQNFGLPVVITRAANVYGPGQQLYRIIPRVVLSCLTNQKFTLDGGGSSIRSFIHIADVCSATYKIATSDSHGETFHISSEQFISIKDLVKLILKKFNKDFGSLVELGPERIGKDQAYLLNADKVKNTLNWQPLISLSAGIDEVCDWALSNIDVLRGMEVGYVHKK